MTIPKIKNRRSRILFLSLLLVASTSFGQSSRAYVKIIIEDVTSVNDAATIDSFMRSQSGVITSRMDRHTSIYLGIYEISSLISIDDFVLWIEALGYSLTCHVEGELIPGIPTIHLSAEDCLEDHPIQLK
jgi:hypothetical protein